MKPFVILRYNTLTNTMWDNNYNEYVEFDKCYPINNIKTYFDLEDTIEDDNLFPGCRYYYVLNSFFNSTFKILSEISIDELIENDISRNWGKYYIRKMFSYNKPLTQIAKKFIICDNNEEYLLSLSEIICEKEIYFILASCKDDYELKNKINKIFENRF